MKIFSSSPTGYIDRRSGRIAVSNGYLRCRWVFYDDVGHLPVKVRLGAASCIRMAGRATLVVDWAMVLARREAKTRVEAIVSDGGGDI